MKVKNSDQLGERTSSLEKINLQKKTSILASGAACEELVSFKKCWVKLILK